MSESQSPPAADVESESAASPSSRASQPPPSAPPPSGAPAAEAEGAPTPDPLETAKAETQRFREQLLRTAADFDNFRKRARREQEDALRRGKENSLKELLPVFDNLERAAASADTAPDVKSVGDGLRMVLKQFVSTIDRLGIKRVPTVGQAFDPSLHEAIQHVDSAEHPAGVIVTEVQAGYSLGDHLLRAAMVVVSKGAGAPPAGEPAETPDVN